MNCETANLIDLVDYLHTLGYDPKKISGRDYWYLSPLRDEKTASFKVNKNKNIWYDHGLGKGGKLVDFATEYFRCDVSNALQKISSFHSQNNHENIIVRPPLHPNNNLLNASASGETAIKIIAAKKPLYDPMLCRYLKDRRIEKSVADKYCYEVLFALTNKQKDYRAIGFKNNAGGYELRNEYFKGSSSPKYVCYLDNNANKIAVFEGFFDFLSYQTIHQNQEHQLTNYLVLNSLSFFERSLLLMEKHQSIQLYLDQDKEGRACTHLAQKRSMKFHDESKLYNGYKDLNDWVMNLGKKQKQSHSMRRHL
jgi:hypothetical protein